QGIMVQDDHPSAQQKGAPFSANRNSSLLTVDGSGHFRPYLTARSHFLHDDPLPDFLRKCHIRKHHVHRAGWGHELVALLSHLVPEIFSGGSQDRKSTRLNSSHVSISYA